MQRGGSLEIQRFAGAFPLVFQRITQRASTAVQELHQLLYFGVVLFFAAARETWRQAHFHLRVDAAGKSRIAAYFDLAAADLKKIKRAARKGFSGTPRRKRAVVGTCGR